MSLTWSSGTTFTIERAGTFALEGAAEASGTAVGVLLIADVAGVALTQPRMVSREAAERYGEIEAHNLVLIKDARAHGLPVALPTPSPFSDRAWVASLPTQSRIDQLTAFPALLHKLNPIPGTAPGHTTAPQDHGIPGARESGSNTTPGFAGHEREIDDDRSDATKYPYVNTYELKTHAGEQARTFLNNCDNDPNNERKSFDTLKSVLKNIDPTPPGWDAHHIVEQSQTPGFGTEAIQNPNNIINIDPAVHRAINAEYNSAPTLGSEADEYMQEHPGTHFSRVRDYVKTLSYEGQREYGLKAVERALENPRVQIPENDRTRMEKDLERLRNIGREAPLRDDRGDCPEPPLAQGWSRLSETNSKPVLTTTGKTPADTIRWAEYAKRIHDAVAGPSEKALNIRIGPTVNVLENGDVRTASVLGLIAGKILGVDGGYMMLAKSNGERMGLDLIQTLAASTDPAATHAMLQDAFQNGQPVQIAMTNTQDLNVTHASAQQLDQNREVARFDDYRGR